MAYRVALASIYHESNTFSTQPTDLPKFHAKCWVVGDELIRFFTGTRTVIGGCIAGASERGLTLLPILGALATPSGPVTTNAMEEIADRLASGLDSGSPFDGALLELHGSMVAEGSDTPELELLRLIRHRLGERPIVAVTDMHMNLSPELLSVVDVIVGYRTNPHVDTFDRGADAARVLREILDGRVRPRTAYVRVPVIAPAVAQRTDVEPLRSILARADEIRAEPAVVEVNIHCGFTYADVPHLGMSISVVTNDDDRLAANRARELAELVWTLRRAFVSNGRVLTVRKAFEEAARAVRQPGRSGPVVIADTGDNINGGGSGDGTWLIREALGHPEIKSLATIWDPAMVALSELAPRGTRVRFEVGGKTGPLNGGTVAIEANVLWVGDGRYKRSGPMATGGVENMGRTAVLRAGSLDLVVQSNPVQPNDPSQFQHCGLEPSDYEIVILKGAAAIRAGWSNIAQCFVEAGTRGFTDSVISRLPYMRITRPLWPFDKAFGWTA